MKAIFSLVGVLCFWFGAIGQQAIDSLQRQLNLSDLPDTARIHLYNELAWEWASIDPQVGLIYADSAYRLAREVGFESGRISALNRRGVNYWNSGQDSLAILAHTEVLGYHLSQDNLKGQASSINNIALIHYNRGEYSKALENHRRASLIFEELGLRKNLVNSLSNEGVVFLALADYPMATELFLKALAQTTEEEAVERGNLYNNLGLVSKNLGDYSQAEKYYLQALELYQKVGNQNAGALTLGNLGAVMQTKGLFAKSEEYLTAALLINRKSGNQRRIASDLTNLGSLKLAQNQPELARVYLDSARFLYESLDEQLNLAQVLLRLAQAGDQQGKPNSQLYELERQSLSAAQSSGSLDALQNSWLAISKRKEKLGDFKGGLVAFQLYTQFKDSIFNLENEKKLLKARIGYEYSLMEGELKESFEAERRLLESEKERERLKAGLLLTGIVAVILIALTVLFFYRKQSQIRQLELESAYRAKMAELELKALKAQMNPHFIFNALSSISNFLLKNQAGEADRYLTKFSRLVRRILEYSEVREIALTEELDLLRDYIALEALRLDKEVIFEIQNTENLPLEQVFIPPLLLQPLVENSLWHGISKNTHRGEICLGIHSEENSLILTLRDNGGGEREAIRLGHKSSSMGMSLVQNRLERMADSEKAGRAWTMLWEKLTDGFEVKLRLDKPAT